MRRTLSRVPVCLTVLTFSLCACTPLITFTPRGAAKTAKSPDCQFELVTGEAPKPYSVVGVIDLEAFGPRYLPKDEAAFRQAIGKAVCQAGGDGVLPGINGDGRYVLATVVTWAVEPSQAAPAGQAGLQ